MITAGSSAHVVLHVAGAYHAPIGQRFHLSGCSDWWGHFSPPNIVKQKCLKKYAEEYNLRVLVETGTLHGDMIERLMKAFDRIYSIELNHSFFEKAKDKFKQLSHIRLMQGDSAKRLGDAINEINESALFWLDAHFSGGETAKGEKNTPIYEELSSIFSGLDRRHVIIIDDARCFGTDPAYPTIKELKEFIYLKKDNVDIIVQDDMIRITPKL